MAALSELRESRAWWMVGTGIRQWLPGEVRLAEMAAQVVAGEWHVLRAGAAVVRCASCGPIPTSGRRVRTTPPTCTA
ncbi:hypothetical protein [Blastococcus montanus]|uniref:hypothetical protein n=1 Tax=Blastococcus montanus TaxID=3144973 RepID=UPI003208CB3F